MVVLCVELSLRDASCRLTFAAYIRDIHGILVNSFEGIRPIVLRARYNEGPRTAERVKASHAQGSPAVRGG